MRKLNSPKQWKVALVAAGAVAVAGAGVATGAYALDGSKTTRVFVSAPASPAAAVPAPATQAAVSALQGRTKPVVHKRHVARRPHSAGSRFDGKLSLDDGLVKLKVLHIAGSAGSGRLGWQLYEHKPVLELGGNVRVVDSRGAQVPFVLLDDAIARVHGRLLPTASWRWSDDELRPVIRVHKIVVLQLDRDLD